MPSQVVASGLFLYRLSLSAIPMLPTAFNRWSLVWEVDLSDERRALYGAGLCSGAAGVSSVTGILSTSANDTT
jgi:hypothetical protein